MNKEQILIMFGEWLENFSDNTYYTTTEINIGSHGGNIIIEAWDL